MDPAFAGSPWAVVPDAYGRMKLMPLGRMPHAAAASNPQTSLHAVRNATGNAVPEATQVPAGALRGLAPADGPAAPQQPGRQTMGDQDAVTNHNLAAPNRRTQAMTQGDVASASEQPELETWKARHSIDAAAASPSMYPRRASVPAERRSPQGDACGPAAAGGLRAAYAHGKLAPPMQSVGPAQKEAKIQGVAGGGGRPMAGLGLRAACAPPEADSDIVANKVAADVWGVRLRRYSGKY